MHLPSPARARLLALSLPLVLAAACSGPRAEREERPEDPLPSAGVEATAPRPWTRAFLEEAVLVAREVRIEGPSGLLDHVAVRQEPPYTLVSVRTVPEGLLQEVTLAEGAAGAEIRAQLDNLAIAAEERLVVLERPGDVPVTVDARGDAYYARRDGAGERRAATLRLVGDAPR